MSVPSLSNIYYDVISIYFSYFVKRHWLIIRHVAIEIELIIIIINGALFIYPL